MGTIVEAGGMRGTPEAIREFYELIDCEAGEVKETPVERRGSRWDASCAPKRRKTARKPGTRQKANQAATGDRAKTADERRISEFERKVVPWGRYAGQRWGDVPLDFVQWFAELAEPKAHGAKALQVAVREYLELKYGIVVGRLF